MCSAYVLMFLWHICGGAEANLGEIDVREALLAKADYLAGIGDRAAAARALDATEAKTAGAGPKMDLAFSLLR